MRGQDPDHPNFSYYADFSLYFSGWFDFLNNKYLLVLDPSQTKNISDPTLIYNVQNDPRFIKVFQDKSVIVYQNINVSPRARFMSDWEYTPEDKMLAKLFDPNFPLDSKITIDKPIGFNINKKSAATISYDSYTPERSVISIDSTANGFLVISDSWYPGWVASVDGNEVPIYKADYAFRAIPVPQGSHKVEFHYEPISFKIGLIISGASLFTLTVIWIFRKQIYKE